MVSSAEHDTISFPCVFGTAIEAATTDADRKINEEGFGEAFLAVGRTTGGVTSDVGSGYVPSLLLRLGERVVGLGRGAIGAQADEDEAPVDERQPSASLNTTRGRDGERGLCLGPIDVARTRLKASSDNIFAACFSATSRATSRKDPACFARLTVILRNTDKAVFCRDVFMSRSEGSVLPKNFMQILSSISSR